MWSCFGANHSKGGIRIRLQVEISLFGSEQNEDEFGPRLRRHDLRAVLRGDMSDTPDQQQNHLLAALPVEVQNRGSR